MQIYHSTKLTVKLYIAPVKQASEGDDVFLGVAAWNISLYFIFQNFNWHIISFLHAQPFLNFDFEMNLKVQAGNAPFDADDFIAVIYP